MAGDSAIARTDSSQSSTKSQGPSGPFSGFCLELGNARRRRTLNTLGAFGRQAPRYRATGQKLSEPRHSISASTRKDLKTSPRRNQEQLLAICKRIVMLPR